uniref:Uncharacterized protein n=1 Tax=Cucumis melo TaxID=3656 RepID=A0A9I9E6B7_CUCME
MKLSFIVRKLAKQKHATLITVESRIFLSLRCFATLFRCANRYHVSCRTRDKTTFDFDDRNCIRTKAVYQH